MKALSHRLSLLAGLLFTATGAEAQSDVEVPPGPISAATKTGPLTVSGVIRVNYFSGDYPGKGSPFRGRLDFDTVHARMNYDDGRFTGAVEYQWYESFDCLCAASAGWRFNDSSSVKLGLQRVPFGLGDYGVSNSYLFDLNYFVGLLDDHGVGASLQTSVKGLTVDLAWFARDAWNGNGARYSARYAVNIVPDETTGDGYREQDQINLRIHKTFTPSEAVSTGLGASIQHGRLKRHNGGASGTTTAVAGHFTCEIGNWNLKTQLSHYDYHTPLGALTPDGHNPDLITIGSYGATEAIAARGWVPAISVAREWKPSLPWLDSVQPFVEYSAIMKDGRTMDGRRFKDSHLLTIGANWSKGPWFIQTEINYSDGLSSVGSDTATDTGANLDAKWQHRFNINVGLEF